MVKRAADDRSLSDKLGELYDLWESHDPEKLPKRLPVKRIKLRPDVYQARGTTRNPTYGDINLAKVDEMRELLKDNPERDMKPVLVLHLPKAKPSQQFVLLDGHHRHMAYVGTMREDIPVEYVTVNPTQALQAANDENNHIREPLTQEGKTQHAWRLLREGLVDHETGKPVTHKWISKTAGVSHQQVKVASAVLGKIRKSGKDIPEDWFRAIGFERDDDEMRNETVERWARDLRKGFPKMTTLGNPELFAMALCEAWPEKIKEIAHHLFQFDEIRHTVDESLKALADEEAREEEESGDF